jgi:putative transcriptional regulator
MVTPGDLLISHVVLRDGVFDFTVVLILDADESGTLGVVLNRVAEVSLGSVLPDWVIAVSEPKVLFDGGPVSPNGAICLASVPGDEEPPGWRRLFGRIGLLHLDTPVELVVGAFDALRIFAGYAGWGPGQLEVELAGDAWFVARVRHDDIFGIDQRDLWRRVLRRQDPDVAIYSTWTEEPDLN